VQTAIISSVTLRAYLNQLSGSAIRLVLQATYFVVLVSTLSVADFGVFASSIALALIIASGGTFGFTAALFRAASTRRRLIGFYIGGFYVYLIGAIPLSLAVAAGFHAAVMHHYLSLAAFLAIVASEAICWRIGDAIWLLNIGLGRYARGAAVSLFTSATRTVAVILFALWGSGGLEQWVLYYLAANVVGTAGCWCLFMPRVRPRFSLRIFRGRLPESLSHAAASMIQSMQLELDKLLILFLAGQKTAGIYALSIRIIDLIAVPVRSFFPIYAQMLMRRRAALTDFASRCGTELAVMLVTTLLFVCFLQVLAWQPMLLGANVAAAYPWFSALLVVPAAKVLLDYHRELFFAANRVFAFTLITILVLAIKIPAMAAIALLAPGLEGWIAPLNLLWLVLYMISALLAWTCLAAASGPRLPRSDAAHTVRPVATRPA
jgi:O-antigen/teichoic acid export membrane protein